MTDGSRIMDWGAINQAAKLPSSVLHPKGDSSAYGTKFTQPKSFPLVTSSIHDKHDQMFFADYDLIETVHVSSSHEKTKMNITVQSFWSWNLTSRFLC